MYYFNFASFIEDLSEIATLGAGADVMLSSMLSRRSSMLSTLRRPRVIDVASKRALAATLSPV